MGFTIAADHKFDDLGVTINTGYYTLKGKCRIVRQTDSDEKVSYIISGHYDIYATKAIHDANGNPLKLNCPFTSTVSSLNGVEPISTMYTDLKTKLKTDLSVTDNEITDYT